MTLASFIPSVSGLNAMSTAQQSVAENIVNMNTTGYKQRQTLFYTLLGSSGMNAGSQSGLHSSRADITGVDAYNRTNLDLEGNAKATGNAFDVAITGNANAFFKLNDGYGNYFYTRAGDFKKLAQDGTAYLVSSGGLFVQGFKSIEGENEFSNTISDITIDAPNSIPQKATTKASIIANVPAKDVDSSIYNVFIYSDNYDGSNLSLVFKRIEGQNNAWNLSFELEDGTAVGSSDTVIFNTDGTIASPENINVSLNWNDGSTSNIDIDISEMTQLGINSAITNIQQNGFPSGNLIALGFNDDGVLSARYSNDNELAIAKLAISGFTAPENLDPYNTTLFEANGEVGNEFYVDTLGLIVPESVESSTVNLEDEFARMITVQRAYSLNAQSLTVNDEMISLLVDLKS